jgi:tetratricopeptide (TPR) repeat protein
MHSWQKVSWLALLMFAAVAARSDVADFWKPTEAAAAKASKAAQFAEAERLLKSNLKLAQTFGPKDPRRPRTLFDLAEVDRAEGKYNDALPLYEQALQIYTSLYGKDATEIADVQNGEAELYKSLNDYAHAEPLLVNALALRQKLLKEGDPDIARVKTISANSIPRPERSIRQSLCFCRRWQAARKLRDNKAPKLRKAFRR